MINLMILARNGRFVADSREVAQMTETRHDHLLAKIDGFVRVLSTDPNFRVSDFFIESSYTDVTGRTIKRYDITRKGCDMVANKMTGEKGVLFTAAYVTRFEEMERNPHKFEIPQTYLEALEAHLKSETERVRLAAQIEQDRPKVIFAEALETSRDSVLIAELAKLLKQNGIDFGQNRLFERLRQDGYLGKTGDYYNLPTQRAMDMKLFEIQKRTIMKADGTTLVSSTTRVTCKGLMYFINKFKRDLVTT